MIVQKTSLDQRLVQAGRVAIATYQGLFAVSKTASDAIFSTISNPFDYQGNSTVNFGYQSPREKVTATAKTVHDKTAGEHTRSRQRISHHWRGIDFSLLAAQNIFLAGHFLVKKSYLSTEKRAKTKILIAV